MTDFTLTDLGWSDHFANQIDAPLPDGHHPARIAEIHRSVITGLTPEGSTMLAAPNGTGNYAVGDWVISDGHAAVTRLIPLTEITRKAAGHRAERQLIAANVETLGIVTSCNNDFNPARIERYLVMAQTAGCLPLVILTKADLTDDAEKYRREAEEISPMIKAITLDARAPDQADKLTPWLRPGMTLALTGSSGTGKTTLLNALTGMDQRTAAIREDDARGRHTTTFRALRRVQAGGWLIDTPGMRELQLADTADGIDTVFEDIAALVATCKFTNCGHETEPGCAVKAALADGSLEQARFARWQKLAREDVVNSESIAEAHSRTRGFQKKARSALRAKAELTQRKR